MDISIWIAIGLALAVALGFFGIKKEKIENEPLLWGFFCFAIFRIISSQPVIIECHYS